MNLIYDFNSVFKDEPKCPPSVTRAIQKVNTITKEKEGFFTPFKNLMKYKTFLVLCNSYGIMIGVLNCDATLLNQLVLAHFQVTLSSSIRFALKEKMNHLLSC